MTSRRAVLRMALAAAGSTLVAGGWAGARAAEGARLALKGYDPVAYFTEGKPVEGKPDFEHAWDEARYRFASAKHLDMFKSDPDRYVPQYRGYCAGNMTRGKRLEADPQNWVIHDSRLFVFGGSKGLERFQANPEEMAKLGKGHWETVKHSGS